MSELPDGCAHAHAGHTQNVKVSALKVLYLNQITIDKTACMGKVKNSEMLTASYTDRCVQLNQTAK